MSSFGNEDGDGDGGEDDDDPLRPQTMVVAYEEEGRVMPVASDFDCFLVGTRGVSYDDPLPPDQVNMMMDMVDEIDCILASDSMARLAGEVQSSDSWTARWLDVLKKKAKGGGDKAKATPQYGYGDPKSYRMMEAVARRLEGTSGAVRHGAECFNLCFPQEIDDHYLVVCDSLPGKVPWKYVGVEELQDILIQRIDDGHTFPLNPKWVLCDPGWKRVWDRLMSSKNFWTQQSLDMWYPVSSGIRERIEEVYARYPNGFQQQQHRECNGADGSTVRPSLEGTEAMDLAEQELKYHLILKRAKTRLRAVLMFGNLAQAHSTS